MNLWFINLKWFCFLTINVKPCYWSSIWAISFWVSMNVSLVSSKFSLTFVSLSACECLYFSVQARVCVVVRTASSSPPLICVTRRRTVRRPASVQASRPSAPHQRRRRTSPSAARAHASVWTGWDAQKHFSRMVAIRQCKTRLHCRRIKSFWISVPEEVKGKERRFRRF